MTTEEIKAVEVIPNGLSPSELDEFALKHRIVSLQVQGLSAAEALARTGCKKTPAWARNLRRRYARFGAPGLLDLRKFNGRTEEVMTSEVKAIVLAFWQASKARGVNNVTTKTQDICRLRGLRVPSESAVRHYLDSLPEPIRMTRGGILDEWDKQAKPTIPFRGSQYANERHQSDHKRMDIHSKIFVDGEQIPVVLSLTPLVDDYSRVVAGLHQTIGTGNAWSITQAIRHAVLPKVEAGWEVCGLPEIFQCDNGKDFVSNAVQTALATLGVSIDIDPPYYPNRKGKVERFFQTLDQGCLRDLPGHMDDIGTSEGAARKNLNRLLTPEDIEYEIKRWIVEDYHERTHSVTGRKPIELWRETVRLRVPDDGDVFRVLLRMEAGTRTVQRVVQFTKHGQGGSYWSLEIPDLYQRKVRVAYNPEDMRRVAIHCEETGEFLSELSLLGHPECPWDEETVKATGGRYRNGLKARIAEHMKRAAELDEELKQDRITADTATAVAEEPEAESEQDVAEEAEQQEVADILDELDSY